MVYFFAGSLYFLLVGLDIFFAGRLAFSLDKMSGLLYKRTAREDEDPLPVHDNGNEHDDVEMDDLVRFSYKFCVFLVLHSYNGIKEKKIF